MLRQMFAILIKDIQIELQHREVLSGMLFFSILCLFIFSFALDDVGQLQEDSIAGILWATIVLAGTLGLNRMMTREIETHAIDGLLLAAIDRSAIVLGKMLGIAVLMFIAELVLLPVGTVLFNVNLFHTGVIVTLLLGTYGYAAVGILVSSMTVRMPSREILLPVLLLPLAIPLLFAVVPGTSDFVGGGSDKAGMVSLLLVVVYDLVMTALNLLLAEFVFDA